MNNTEILRRASFFAGVLGEADLDALAAGARRAEFDRGQTIMREGDRGASLFVIVRGAATVSIRDGAVERTIATLGDGDIVGEMSLLTGAPRAATVVAVRPTVTAEIPKAALGPIIRRMPKLADRFAEVVQARAAELDRAYGPLNWIRPSEHARQLTDAIRRFFADG